MKKFLTFVPSQESYRKPADENGYIQDTFYLCGFKQVTYQDMRFDVHVDGELYNQEALMEELQHFDIPALTCMEELFLHAYLIWGMDAMKHLEGAYSFTIKREDSILTIKDPLGLVPVYYMQDPRGIWISNTLDTLLENSDTSPVLGKDALIELFAFGPGISEEKTLFENINALPMGCMLQVQKQKVHIQRYYTLVAKPHCDDLETTIHVIHDLVHDSVCKQMKGANASFLSGGLDSSIITSICAKQQANWHTYALDYEGNAENFKENRYQVSLDQGFIDDMVSYCAAQHTTLTITQKELCDHLEDAMLARGMPGMADVDAALLWLCEQCAKHESIVLSGECSDELMGGYPWFYRADCMSKDTFPWLRYSKQRISLLHASLQDIDYQGYIDKRYQESVAMVDTLESDCEADRFARMQTVLVLHWFMQSLVTRQVCEGDRANLIIRAPFANVKLLEYVYNIPWSMKFLQGEEKGILRKAFEDELPKSIVHRKKNPFPKTHNPEYATRIADKLKQRLLDPDSALHILFDDVQLEKLIASKGASYPLPFYGQLMCGPQLLAYIYQIDCWIKDYHITIAL